MLTSAYKYLAMGGVALALIVGAFLYGLHTGKTAGIAVLNETVASLNAQAAATLKAANAAQQDQITALQKSASEAMAQAQAAKQTAQQTLSTYQAALAKVSRETSVQNWNAVCIPAAIRSSVQFAPTCAGDQGDPGNGDQVRPNPR